MNPIEIHIEGYKIVISEDKETEIKKTEQKEEMKIGDRINYVPYPVVPCSSQPADWWSSPHITWCGPEPTVTNTTKADSTFTPIRDAMVGKESE